MTPIMLQVVNLEDCAHCLLLQVHGTPGVLGPATSFHRMKEKELMRLLTRLTQRLCSQILLR